MAWKSVVRILSDYNAGVRRKLALGQLTPIVQECNPYYEYS